MGEKAAKVIKGATFALLYIFIYTFMQFVTGLEIVALNSDIMNCEGIAMFVSAVASFAIYNVIFYLRDIDRRKIYKIGRLKILDIVFALTLAAGFRILTSVYISWAERIKPLKESIDNAQAYDTDNMTLIALLTVLAAILILAPTFEEVLFRGIVLNELKNVMPVSLAIVLQGIFFGIAHLVLAQSIFTAVFGVVLGYVYYKTKKLSVTMTAHFAFNISAAFEVTDAETAAPLFAAGLLITAFSVVMFALLYRTGEKPKMNVAEELNNG